MQEKKELKIKFKTAVILFVILLIILIATFFLLINRKTNISEETNASNITNSNVINNETIEQSNFSVKFLKLENNNQNMIYSPLSIKYALKMLNEGANGNTKTQIENIIGDMDLTKYNNIDGILSLANGVYIRDTYSNYVKEDYTKILTEKYNTEINYDSFSNADNINNWIENKTFGIIKNMLQDNTVQNPDSKMLLINALAIDMEWEEDFDSGKTKGANFYFEDGSTMTATTMNKKATYSDNISYYQDEDITSLTMNLKKYNDTQLEFIAIMPKGNLSDYIEDFSMEDLNNIIEKSTPASKSKNGVDISIPKFSFDYNLNLKEDLMKLGITDAFDKDLADFSNMYYYDEVDSRLFVGDALHKANIDFTEKGIKASAVTVILMTDTMAIMEENKPIEIKIDKPFLYVIRDKNTGEIWFIGTVHEPNSWEDDRENYQYR